jgi:hypothetical protein
MVTIAFVVVKCLAAMAVAMAALVAKADEALARR